MADIAISLVAVDNPGLTLKCLQSLLTSVNQKRHRLKLFLWDNSLNVSLKRVLKSDSLGIPVLQRTHYRNEGIVYPRIWIMEAIQKENFHFVLELHNDMLFMQEGWLDELLKYDSPSIGILMPFLVWNFHKNVKMDSLHQWVLPRIEELAVENPVQVHPWLLKMEMVREIGYYDPQFAPYWGEDNDFYYRVIISGKWHAIAVKSAWVAHQRSFSILRYAKETCHPHRELFLKKHGLTFTEFAQKYMAKGTIGDPYIMDQCDYRGCYYPAFAPPRSCLSTVYWKIIAGIMRLLRLMASWFSLVCKTVNALLRFPIRIEAHQMFLHLDKQDYVSRCLRASRFYEPRITDAMMEFIHRGDTVVDIGAQIGYFTLQMAHLAGQEGKVYAFEPDPDNFKILQKNIRINGYRQITQEQKAVAIVSGRTRLYYLNSDKGDARIYDPGGQRLIIDVETVCLDDYFNGCEHSIRLIKMDTQGAEFWILRGMQGILRKNRDLKIITEFQPNLIRKAGFSERDFLSFLIKHGFTLYDLKEREKPVENIDDLIEKYVCGNTDLLCDRDGQV